MNQGSRTLRGRSSNHRSDHRLVHFARSLAASGVTCVVPTLPGLARGRLETGDLDLLESVLVTVSKEWEEEARRAPAPAGSGGLGLVGFSFGASYSLVAATRPTVSERLSFVLAFGAYHSLAALFDGYVASAGKVPASEAEWDAAIYLRLVLASSRLDGIGEEASAAIPDLLARYCREATAEEKRRFYESHLRDGRIIAEVRAGLSAETLEALSPAGRVAAVHVPVSLIHDRHDPLVPAAHGQALYAELRSAPSPAAHRHRLLLTSLLTHVSPGDLLRPGELLRLAAALAHLVDP